MTVDEFHARLERVKKNGTGWMACCPAHENRRASLGVGVGEDDRILAKCWAGCRVDAIVAALEALEDGDQRHAVEILLAALEDVPRPVGVRCGTCGLRFEWPGLLDHQQRFSHWTDEEQVAA